MPNDKCGNPVASASYIFGEYEVFIRTIIQAQNIKWASNEDIFQDFFLALVSKPIPDDVASIKSFLYKAILNQIAISYRQTCSYKEKIKKFTKKSNFKDNKIDSISALIREEQLNKMLEMIKNNAPERKYMAICLRYRDGYTIDEIADIMGVKNSSIRSYIAKGLWIVRKYILENGLRI